MKLKQKFNQNKSKLTFSKKEFWLFFGLLIISGLFLSIQTINDKVQIEQSKERLTKINQQTNRVQVKNQNLKNLTAELQSSDRLKAIANQQNLFYNSNNVKSLNEKK